MDNVYINPILSIREHAKEIENGTYSGLELARKFLTFNNDRGYLENCASAIAKDVKETLNGLMKETYNHYNSTIDYVAKHLKKYGEKGLPVVWDDYNYIADAVYDDCECVRYEINAIRVSHRVYPCLR